MKTLKSRFNQTLMAGAAAITAMAPGVSRATDSLPLDLSSAGTTLAGYVATAAGAGIGVAVAIWGIRVIVKAFKTVISK